MKTLIIALLASTGAFASQCDVLVSDRNLPTEIADLIQKKGYDLNYFDLDDSSSSLNTNYKLKYREIRRGAFGAPIYAMRFKGKGLKIKAKGLDKDELVKALNTELTTCL